VCEAVQNTTGDDALLNRGNLARAQCLLGCLLCISNEAGQTQVHGGTASPAALQWPQSVWHMYTAPGQGHNHRLPASGSVQPKDCLHGCETPI
jgi:hypothetical protein